MTVAAWVWGGLARLAAPALPFYLRRRLARGKELAGRLEERRGGGVSRPPGRLLWLHAASVGETLSILPVLEALATRAPRLMGAVYGAVLEATAKRGFAAPRERVHGGEDRVDPGGEGDAEEEAQDRAQGAD